MKYLSKLTDADLISTRKYLNGTGNATEKRFPLLPEGRGIRDREGRIVPMNLAAIEGEMRERGLLT